MPIYLNLDGITGDATHQNHQGWTDIQSLTWNIARSMNTLSGSTANREGTQPTVGEVLLTKTSDGSTPSIITEAAAGSTGKTAVIHVVSTGSPGSTYLEFTLSNVLVSSYTINTTGDRPTEAVNLNFTKIETKYIKTDATNASQSQRVSSYDVSTSKAG